MLPLVTIFMGQEWVLKGSLNPLLDMAASIKYNELHNCPFHYWPADDTQPFCVFTEGNYFSKPASPVFKHTGPLQKLCTLVFQRNQFEQMADIITSFHKSYTSSTKHSVGFCEFTLIT